MKTRHVLDRIADCFESGKAVPNSLRDEFLHCIATLKNTKARSLDVVFGKYFESRIHAHSPKNQDGMREKCFDIIFERHRTAGSVGSLKQKAFEEARKQTQVGLDQIKDWWKEVREGKNLLGLIGDDSVADNDPDLRREMRLSQMVWFIENRPKRTEWEQQPVRRNDKGEKIFASFAILRKRQQIPRKKKIPE